jgi:hypothetical protein
MAITRKERPKDKNHSSLCLVSVGPILLGKYHLKSLLSPKKGFLVRQKNPNSRYKLQYIPFPRTIFSKLKRKRLLNSLKIYTNIQLSRLISTSKLVIFDLYLGGQHHYYFYILNFIHIISISKYCSKSSTNGAKVLFCFI